MKIHNEVISYSFSLLTSNYAVCIVYFLCPNTWVFLKIMTRSKYCTGQYQDTEYTLPMSYLYSLPMRINVCKVEDLIKNDYY